MLISLVRQGLTGKEADAALGRVGITVNKNAVPNDPQSPFVTSGIRIGTPASSAWRASPRCPRCTPTTARCATSRTWR